MKFTHWKVKNGKAMPVNPYSEPSLPYEIIKEPTKNEWLQVYQDFNVFAQANTLDTDLPEKDYNVEDVEPELQKLHSDGEWRKVSFAKVFSTTVTRKALVLKEPKKVSGEINNETFKTFMEKRPPHDGSDEGECNAFTKLKEEPKQPETVEEAAEMEANYWVTPNDEHSFNNRQMWGIVQKAFIHGNQWEQSNLISRDKAIEAITAYWESKEGFGSSLYTDIIHLIETL